MTNGTVFSERTLAAAREAVDRLGMDLTEPVHWTRKIALARELGMSVEVVPVLLRSLRRERGIKFPASGCRHAVVRH